LHPGHSQRDQSEPTLMTKESENTKEEGSKEEKRVHTCCQGGVKESKIFPGQEDKLKQKKLWAQARGVVPECTTEVERKQGRQAPDHLELEGDQRTCA